MDIKREPPKKTKKIIAYGAGLVAIVAVSIGISRLKPAAPPVERGTLWIDTVKRGMMTRDVNAPGTLEPEYVRNITALTSGRVEELPVRPGINVTTNTLLVVMSSPDEQIKELQYEQSLNQAIGNLANLKTTLHQQILSQQSNLASTRTAHNDAVRQAAVQDSLAKKNLSSANDVAAAHDKINEYKQRMDIEQNRLEDMQRSEKEQIQLNEQQIEGLRRILADQRRRVASMRVTSPESGQLQMLGNPPLELGQYVNAGTLLARVVQPGKLKAVLRIAAWSSYFGSSRPGVSKTIICMSPVVWMPTTRSRVDWGFWLVIASFCPTMRLRSVDFPAFGFPATVTMPAFVMRST